MKKRTLMEFVKSMLESTKLPIFFFGEGIVLACCLQNQSYTAMLRGQVVILYECWRGNNQSLSFQNIWLHYICM